MKKIAMWILCVSILSLSLSSCATTERTYQGAAAGGALGAGAGALLDQKNRWRGALIGGLLGTAFGGSITEISSRAAQEAVQTKRPVSYQRIDGSQKIEATPVGFNPHTRCHKVQEKVWEDGKLVKNEIKTVCEG